MLRIVPVVSSALACVLMVSTAGHAAPRSPSQRTVESATASAARPAPARDRSRLFAPDTGADTTATVAGNAPRNGCGTIACKNYTIMGVGF